MTRRSQQYDSLAVNETQQAVDGTAICRPDVEGEFASSESRRCQYSVWSRSRKQPDAEPGWHTAEQRAQR